VSVPGASIGTLATVKVELPSGAEVTAEAAGDGDLTFVLAHGAGTDRHHRSIVGIRDAIVDRGVRVVTFNYPYTEAGRRGPDRAPVLLECHTAVASAVERRFGRPLFTGGRSMGGRIATMLVADGHPCDGVVLFAYPLHPAGKPDRLRVDHLGSITVPLLFFQGSRDALSRSELFDRHVRRLPTATVVDMEGADHSFRGRGWTESDLYEFLAEHTVGWMRRVAKTPT
jgi:uncharacterized protein